MGVMINDKHSLEDWGMIVTSIAIESPPLKDKTLDIAGADGRLDLSDLLVGRTLYDNRNITVEFKFIDTKASTWHRKYSDFASAYHGGWSKLIFDNDNKFYYEGRTSVSSSRNNGYSNFTLKINARPYKYDIYSSIENWLWDPFDFEYDIAREYTDKYVNKTLQMVVVGSVNPIHPKIITSSKMKLVIENEEYELTAGNTTLYDLTLENRDYIFQFIGTGYVSINMRGGQL